MDIFLLTIQKVDNYYKTARVGFVKLDMTFFHDKIILFEMKMRHIDSFRFLKSIEFLFFYHFTHFFSLFYFHFQNGFVECEQENCPAVDDCYMLEKKNGCCEKCKGNTLKCKKMRNFSLSNLFKNYILQCTDLF